MDIDTVDLARQVESNAHHIDTIASVVTHNSQLIVSLEVIVICLTVLIAIFIWKYYDNSKYVSAAQLEKINSKLKFLETKINAISEETETDEV
jgi:hypothetical protein